MPMKLLLWQTISPPLTMAAEVAQQSTTGNADLWAVPLGER